MVKKYLEIQIERKKSLVWEFESKSKIGFFEIQRIEHIGSHWADDWCMSGSWEAGYVQLVYKVEPDT